MSDLLDAVRMGDIDTVLLLLDNGADPHAHDDGALGWAILKGDAKIVKILIAKGANIHARDGCMPRWVARLGCVEILQAMFSADNVFNAGEDPRGYRFFGIRFNNAIIVAAGCRWFDINKARKHWANNPDALTRVEQITQWAAGGNYNE